MEDSDIVEDNSDIAILSLIEDTLQSTPTVENPIILFQSGRELISVNPRFDKLGLGISGLPAYNGHEMIYIARHVETDALFIAAVHNTKRGPALGGCRETHYDSPVDAITDVLRLSQGMTYKCAISNLDYGGGKGVIMLKPGTDSSKCRFRVKLYKAWGQFISTMKGIHITAEDLGNTTKDTRIMLSTTRFVTCLPDDVGGGGNPSIYTAEGVLLGTKSCAKAVYGTDSLHGLVINVQGVGNVGSHLVGRLVAEGAKVRICDINTQTVERLVAKYPKVEVCAPDENFYQMPCDVFAPCARGGILNHRTIPFLQCRIVAGAANNQLEDPTNDALLLAQRNIVYGPDYVLNMGGAINAAQEIIAPFDVDSVHKQVERVGLIMDKILAQGSPTNPPSFIADKMASELAEQIHPKYGHLGARRILDLIKMRHESYLLPAA